jgi:cell division protein FtsQ
LQPQDDLATSGVTGVRSDPRPRGADAPPDDVVVIDETIVIAEHETITDETETVTGETVTGDDVAIDVEMIDDVEVIDDPIEVIADDDMETPPFADPANVVRRTGVDPRIRARRIAVAREQGRRRLRVLVVFLSVFVAVGTACLIVRSPLLAVDHIVVTGVPPERVAAVIAAADIHHHAPLLLVSTGAVAQRVERVPGIGTVSVRREFPGTLRISAHVQGVALWARDPAGGVALIGYDGRVQRIASTPPPNIIELRGVAHIPAPGDQIADRATAVVMTQLPPSFSARVGAISATSSTDVRLYLIVGGEVRLGDLSSVHDKGVAAEAVLERMGCAVSYLDVSSIANPVALPAPGATCNP